MPVGDELHHFWRDNSDPAQPWYPTGAVATGVTGPGCIIQSDFGGDHKNFEIVVRVGGQLVHWWRDNSDNSHPWYYGGVVVAGVSGPGCIIQSDFGGGDHKNFEVVVPVGDELRHFWRDNSDPAFPWRPGQTISVATTGPGTLIQSTRGLMVADGGPAGHSNFEVLIQELTKSVVHYWHHNVDVKLPWWRSFGEPLPGFCEDHVSSPDIDRTVKVAQLTGEFDRQLKIPTLSRTESRYGVIGTDLGQSFEHDGKTYFLFGDTNPNTAIRENPEGLTNLDSIAFTTDENAEQGIHLEFNLTYPKIDNIDQQTFCVPADGVSIPTGPAGAGWIIQSDFGGGDHNNFEAVVWQGDRLVHWWHDNSDAQRGWRRGQVIATAVTGPGCIIQSDFGGGDHKNFEVVVPIANQLHHYWHDNSDVNSDWQPGQVITKPSMYVFFTTDRIMDPLGDPNSMGRSVLARTEDGGFDFGAPMYDFSTSKFINVSLQVVANTDFPGLPDKEKRQGLLLWGSGTYRQSNVYLAYVPLDRIEDRSAYWYFSAPLQPNPHPQWSKDEAAAQPLFLSGTVGELCVRWDAFLKRFILLYNGQNPPYIIERQSPRPWGPWSSEQNIFDQGKALGKFMHLGGSNDGLSDPGTDDGGGAYGPYIISRYTTPNDDGSTTTYFVLSVHNPYNTMLMSTITRARK